MSSSMEGTSLDLTSIAHVSSTVKNCCYGLSVEENLIFRRKASMKTNTVGIIC